MINGTFVAQHMSFKGDDETVNKAIPIEITEVSKGNIEIAFNIGKTRHYLKFPKLEFEAAIKDFRRKDK